MTAQQIEIAQSLSFCRLLPGSWNKRFIRAMAEQAKMDPGKEISESQSEWLYRLLYKYRKQRPHTYGKYQHHPYCKAKPKK